MALTLYKTKTNTLATIVISRESHRRTFARRRVITDTVTGYDDDDDVMHSNHGESRVGKLGEIKVFGTRNRRDDHRIPVVGRDRRQRTTINRNV